MSNDPKATTDKAKKEKDVDVIAVHTIKRDHTMHPPGTPMTLPADEAQQLLDAGAVRLPKKAEPGADGEKTDKTGL